MRNYSSRLTHTMVSYSFGLCRKTRNDRGRYSSKRLREESCMYTLAKCGFNDPLLTYFARTKCCDKVR